MLNDKLCVPSMSVYTHLFERSEKMSKMQIYFQKTNHSGENYPEGSPREIILPRQNCYAFHGVKVPYRLAEHCAEENMSVSPLSKKDGRGMSLLASCKVAWGNPYTKGSRTAKL
jgi:hypothetical protein